MYLCIYAYGGKVRGKYSAYSWVAVSSGFTPLKLMTRIIIDLVATNFHSTTIRSQKHGIWPD